MSTDTDQATGNAIPPVTYDGVEYTVDSVEYRLAKFSAELSDHFIEEAVIFYYLFTEIFLSIDQREKNAFPTYIASLGRWIILFYDADSSCGTDNKGNLTFDYYLEDIDYTQGGDPIYNGQNSVLWRNLRETRRGEIAAMYKDFRTRVENGIGYESVIGRFESHQGKWPEAIFNEDMQTKYLEPLIGDVNVDVDGDGTVDGAGIYLPMLQGKKEMWMQWWLYNRFRYLDSKYETGSSMERRITIRTHAKGNVTLTSYVNMYGRVYYNAEMVEHRMDRGQAQEFVWAATGAEDAVLGINDADMLTSLGDLSPLIVELIDASKATHLTALKIGDASEDYRNYSLNSITLGNNTLLRTLDVRNCPNLEQSVDISGCTNIEEVYFDGTSITGLILPNGGVLTKLHVPAMANLTVRNQPKLEEFVMEGNDYSNITTLWLEGVGDAIPGFDILNSMPDNSRVRLINFDWSFNSSDDIETFTSRLSLMRGLDEYGNNTELAQMSGILRVPRIAQLTLDKLNKLYPSLEVIYDEIVNPTYVQLLEGKLYSPYVNSRVTKLKGYDGYSGVLRGQTTTGMHFTFPNVETVGAGQFYYNRAVKYVDFPAATSMGGAMFTQSLVEAVLLRNPNTVCTIAGTGSFGGFYGYIYVPSALLASYQSATNWSSISNRIRALEQYTVDGTIDGEFDWTKV